MIDKNLAAYKIPYGMYIAIGGDPEREFTSIADIYTEINKIYASIGNRLNIKPLATEITTNGTYKFNEDDVTGYKPVEVSVNVDVGTAYEDGYNTGYGEGYTRGETAGYNTGYSEGLDDGIENQKSKLESISITENGTYNREDGYNEVKVNVKGRLEIPFEEIGYPLELKNELINELNSKPLSDLEYSKRLYTANTTYYNGDNKLVYAPLVNTSNIKNMGYMFQDCSSLTTVPLFNTCNVTDMKRMFFGCNLLTSIPQFITSKVTNMSYMFSECTNLTSIPQLATSKVTDMSYMFSECTNLTSIPQLDTGSVTTMRYMFQSCVNLTSIPQLATSKVTDMSYMFNGCTNLTSIPQLDTGSVTTMSGMLTNCSKLTSIPQFDASKVTDIGLFGYSGNDSIVNLGGFVNLGMQKSVNKTSTNYFLGGSSKLTYESVMNVINNLYDRASAGYSVLTLKFNSKALALLSDEEKAIATNKGWTLS